MKTQTIMVHGREHEIRISGRWVEVDGQRHRMKDLPTRRIAAFFGETELPIPEARVLLVSGVWSPQLVVDGVYYQSQKPYRLSEKLPPWIYIFLALYVLGFFFLVGGAIGGALAFLGAVTSMKVSMMPEYSTPVQISICCGILIATWAAALVIAFVFYFLISGFLF